MQKMKCKGHRLGLIVSRIRGRGNSYSRGRDFPRGRGRGSNPPRGGGHQVNFCKTQIEERSENGIENIYQSKGDNFN